MRGRPDPVDGRRCWRQLEQCLLPYRGEVLQQGLVAAEDYVVDSGLKSALALWFVRSERTDSSRLGYALATP